MSARQPLSGAERARRHRARRRAGRSPIILEVDLNAATELLLARGLILERESEDDREISKELSALVDAFVAAALGLCK